MAGIMDFLTGGKNNEASEAQRKALEALQGVQTPTQQQLSLPELQQYAISQNMTPAQMQAFLQQNNALNVPVSQTGTAAQEAALSQLAGVAGAGAEGSPTQRAQEEQINQDAARNLAGQRGAIDQQAAARGVPVGMLQAALGSQRAGEDLQGAHMAGLQAQGQNYQQALQALASGGALGGQLQGQQNTQANTIGQAQNAMQQFNAANQQNAGAQNAGFQQAANATNTQNANQVGAANTGLANQRTQYNAQLPQQVFQNQMQKAGAVAGQGNQIANTATGQGQQAAGLGAGLLGAGATIAGGMFGGPAGAAAGSQIGGMLAPRSQYGDVSQSGTSFPGKLTMAEGGVVSDPDEMAKALEIMRISPYAPPQNRVPGPDRGVDIYQGPDNRQHAAYSRLANEGGVCMPHGGMIPGHARVPGDSRANDTVPIRVSPGEAIVPRTQVQQHPMDVMRLLRGSQSPQQSPQNGPGATHHSADVAALLQAMAHLRSGGPR